MGLVENEKKNIPKFDDRSISPEVGRIDIDVSRDQARDFISSERNFGECLACASRTRKHAIMKPFGRIV